MRALGDAPPPPGNPAAPGGDLFGSHQFGASVGWLDGQVLVGAPAAASHPHAAAAERRRPVRIGDHRGSVGQRADRRPRPPQGVPVPALPELTEPGGRLGAAVAGFGVHVLAGAPASDSAFEFVEGQGLVPIFSGIPDAGVVYVNTQDGSFVGTLVTRIRNRATGSARRSRSSATRWSSGRPASRRAES